MRIPAILLATAFLFNVFQSFLAFRLKLFLKRLAYLFLYLLVFENGFAQDPNGITLPRIIPPTPVAQEFQKFLGYPVSGATGLVDVSIPIYDLQIPGIDIPISLKYHSSGIKVDQSYGNVGFGWTLFPAFRITRTIMGKPDEFYRTDLIYDNPDQDYYADIATPAEGSVSSSDGTIRDGQFDIFNVSLPNYTGSFILKRNSDLTFKAMPIPDAPLQITVNNNCTYFEVTDDKGIRYLFGDGTDEYRETSNGLYTSWLLKQIILPGTNNVINFHYDAMGANAYGHFDQSVTIWDAWVCSTTCGDGTIGEFMGAMQIPVGAELGYAVLQSSTPSVNSSTPRCIKSIEFSMGKIDFTYDNILRLQNIKILSNDQQLLKTISFTINQRNCLTKVVVPGAGEYNMEYNSQDFDDMPDGHYGVYAQDRWGFYNHKSNQTLVPKITINVRNNAFGSGDYLLSSFPVQFGDADREPDEEAMKANSLEKIVYPTGGWSKFTYEAHRFQYKNQIKFGGGLRIKQIDTYDPVSQKTIVKTYKYGENESGLGMLVAYPDDNSFIDERFILNHISCGFSKVRSRRITIGSSSRFRYYNLGMPVWYKYVTEYSGGGKTVSEYSFTPDAIAMANYNSFSSTEFMVDVLENLNNLVMGEPVLKKKQIFKGEPGNAYTIVREEENTYNLYNQNQVEGKIVDPVCFMSDGALPKNRSWTVYYQSFTNFQYGITDPFMIYPYYILTGKNNLTSTITRNFKGNSVVTSTQTFDFDPSYPYNMISSSKNTSDGSVLNEKLYYPNSATIPGYATLTTAQQQMVATLKNNNRLTSVIQREGFKNNTTPLTSTLYGYKDWGNSILQPEQIYSKTQSGAFESRLRFNSYDNKGNVLSVSKENDHVISYIWDYQQTFPVAEIANAAVDQVAYTSFEADGTGNWQIGGSQRTTTDAITGKQCYQLSNGNISKAGLDPAKKYVLSYWAKPTASVSATGTQSAMQGAQRNGWVYWEKTISGIATLDVSGAGLIDEVRLRPENALMTTYTYEPLIGITSKCDAAGKITYYEYDNDGRLKDLRDIDRNIIKTFDYHFKQ